MWSPRLLVVDDDKVVADLVCRIAENTGFKTRAASGVALSSEYEHFEPDVIALDILMPDIDGFEVLRYISESPRSFSVIILSGTKPLLRTMAERMGNELGLNIIANVAKPFTVAGLQSVFLKAKRQHPIHASEKLRKVASQITALRSPIN